MATTPEPTPPGRSAARARLLHLLRQLRRRSAGGPVSPATVGWAVRRDWLVGGGTHEFVGWRPDRAAALRQLKRDRAFWRTGVKPRFALVRISHRDYRLHFRRWMCAAPDCPVPDPESVLATAGVWWL